MTTVPIPVKLARYTDEDTDQTMMYFGFTVPEIIFKEVLETIGTKGWRQEILDGLAAAEVAYKDGVSLTYRSWTSPLDEEEE